jgi:ubiquinone/menaquinone biosynthesis C-methylase UbiE
MTRKGEKSGIAEGYLHGFSPEEQSRLYKQAKFLAPSVYDTVDFTKQSQVLEVGMGVGAQTEILLDRFPSIKIRGIDASQAQIDAASKRLAPFIQRGRVDVQVADAMHLPFEDNAFDGAFLCWFLEHVQEPVEILREVRRVMRPNGVIFCCEVLNATFFVHPYSPATLQYWFAFNDHQWLLKGDPFVGAKLANYLISAGFQDVTTQVKTHHYDNRSPKRRAEFIEYWTELLLSGAPGLLKAGKVTAELIDEMKVELARLKSDPNAVFFYTWIQARAQAY